MRDTIESRSKATPDAINPSKSTIEKCSIAKKYIEERYERLLEDERSRLAYLNMLNSKMKELNIGRSEQRQIKEEFLKYEAQMHREK